MRTASDPGGPDEKVRDARIASRHRGRTAVTAMTVALIACVGVGLLLLPSAEQWFSRMTQAARLSDLTAAVQTRGGEVDHDAIAAAQTYNERLGGGAAHIAAGQQVPQAEGGGGSAYDRLLNHGADGLMARLMIPSIGADLPVYHGTSDAVLRRGVGHLKGTSLPVGGVDSHAVLTAHRGLASAELFTRLDEVERGDSFSLLVAGEVLAYRVISTRVVDPDETQTLYPRRGQDLVTLVTCTPLGINSQRILVTGERVLPTPPDDSASARGTPMGAEFPWWAVGFGLTVLGGACYVVTVVRRA